ncbi:MAG: TonB-dependent receptor [Steroidobacteraceae bacterium]
MKSQRRALSIGGLIVAGGVGLAGVSQAQEAEKSDGFKLEEIVVTAQKREESQQTVPIAITTNTSDMLQRLGVQSTKDLQIAVPGLVLMREALSNTTFIRGVGTASAAAGQEPSVATYVDGVYNPSPTSSTMSFTNIDRIEVLRGPQGTLFGRNTTGGVINVVTRDPTQEGRISADATYGKYDTVRGRLYGTTGLSNAVAADLAVYYENQGEGYGRNVTLDEERRGDEDISVRTKWLVTPSDVAEVRVGAFYSKIKSTLGVDRDFAPGTFGVGGFSEAGGWQDVQADFENKAEIETYGGNVTVDVDFESFHLKSISGYRKDDNFFAFDQDGVPLPIIDADIFFGAKTFTQEVQFASKTDSKLNWIVGLYYFDNKAYYDPLNLNGAGIGPVTVDIFSQQASESYAIFGQTSWDITEATKLTLGARWSRDEITLSGHTRVSAGGVTLVDTPYEDATGECVGGPTTRCPKATFEEPTYRVGIDHQFTDDFMVYATYNHGYKSGTFNLVVTGAPAPSVKPEKLDAYEIGLKSELFDNRARLNVSAFYYDFKNLQLVTHIAGGQSTRNAAAAEIYGGEAELNVAATEQLSFQTAIALLDTKYKDFLNGPMETPNGPPAGGNTPSTANFSGNDLVRAPKFTANASIDYRIPSSVGEFGTSLNYYYNDGYFWDSENRLPQDSYSLVNAQIRWLSPDERYNVKLWANNLLDKKYTIFGNTEALGDQLAPAPPRTYGITVGFDF